MGWRRRSGNPIALRAERGAVGRWVEERRQTSAAGPVRAEPSPGRAKRTRFVVLGNPWFLLSDTRSDMNNDLVPCVECVLMVEDMSAECFCCLPRKEKKRKEKRKGWAAILPAWPKMLLSILDFIMKWAWKRSILATDLPWTSFMLRKAGVWTFKTSSGKLPALREKEVERGRETEGKRGHYDYSLQLLPTDEAFVFTWKYDLFFHQSEGLCLSPHSERVFGNSSIGRTLKKNVHWFPIQS